MSESAAARRLPLGFIEPCLAVEATKVPSGPGWVHEIEASDQRFSHYARILQEKGYVWGKHYLPHDGGHRSGR